MKKFSVIIAFMAILMIGLAFAASTVETSRLNYDAAAQHTIIVTNGEGTTQTAYFTIPASFSWVSGSGCSNSGQDVTCATIGNGASVSFVITSPGGSLAYHTTSTLNGTIGSTTLPNLKYVRIADKEIFLTLVEYGRGKSCYFYSSTGMAGSGQDQQGYNFLPANESFEINWLHKMYPTPNNYLGVPTAEGSGISFQCTYPNQTVTKEHLITDLTIGNRATATFNADLLTNSWERVFWITQGYSQGEYSDGNSITINCTAINYQLPAAYGNVSIAENSFNLVFATKTPVTMGATSVPSSIGNGTSEVEITYTFTNSGTYPLSTGKEEVTFEIMAPQYATFIGTRGELWGTSQDRYILTVPDLAVGETATITLVARFDTEAATATPLSLTQGATAIFIPTWQLNCYNPMALTQVLAAAGSLTVNYGTPASVLNVQQVLTNINNTVSGINTYLVEINQTTMQTLSYVTTLNNTVTNIQSTVNTINTNVNELNDTVTNIESNTNAIIEQLDCDTVADTPICQYVIDINGTVSTINSNTNSILNFVNEINSTTWMSYNSMQNNFSNVFSQFNTLQSNVSNILTQIDLAQQYLDCSINTQDSVCYRLGLLESYSLEINATTQQNYNNILYMNNTLLPSINSSIINYINTSLNNQNSGVAQLSEDIRHVKEFQEESIYLITDSMVESQQAAMQSFQEGNIQLTTEKLTETNELTTSLSRRVDKILAEQTTPVQPVVSTTTGWNGILQWLDNLFHFRF